MSQISHKRFFYINSGNQLSTTSNSFSQFIQVPSNEQYDRIVVTQANIPISYYVIQAGYNTFQLIEPGHAAVTLTVPPGNYTALSFASVLPGILNAGSPSGFTYKMTFPNNITQTQTGLFTYQVNTGTGPISFVFNSVNPINEQFGFNIGSTATFVSNGSVSNLTSANVVKFVPEDALFLHCGVVDAGNNDILQEFYNQNNIPFSINSWVNPDPIATSKKLFSNNMSVITFSITNENGIPIYFNGLNVVFTIMMYRDCTMYSKAEKYMALRVSEIANSVEESDEQINEEPTEESIQPVIEPEVVGNTTQAENPL